MRPVRDMLLAASLAGVGSTHVDSQSSPFTEEATSRGVFHVTSFGQWVGPYGYGLALNDLDGDGDLDLLLTGGDLGQVKVYENDGTGQFTERPLAGLPTSLGFSGVSCADFDGDGDLDVYLSGWLIPNRLYRNDGDFELTDVTERAGVGDAGFATGTSWGDVNGDGWLDLYVCNRTGSTDDPFDTTPNRLYTNQGDGTFIDQAAALGVDDAHKTFQSVFFDHDLDGDLDLYVANDKGDAVGTNHNRLWRNDAGTFVEISVESGTDFAHDYMGLDIADFDKDGDLDIYSTNIPQGNLLLLNDGDGTYVESSALAGVETYEAGWGTLFWDFDNDTFLDLFVGNSYAPNSLYEFDGTFPCAEVGELFQIHDAGYSFPGSSYGCATGDLDGDGDLDLVVQTWNEPIAIFVNHEGTHRNWLRVKLWGEFPNTHAVGAMVVLDMNGGEQWRQLKAGAGYKSSSELVLHFGLGLSAVVQEVRIRWPDGSLSVLEDVAANQLLEVDRSSVPLFADCNRNLIPDVDEIAADASLDVNLNGILDACEIPFSRGDANQDGGLDLGDAIAMLDHVFAGSEASCLEALDANDDGRIDIADAITLLGHLFALMPAPPPPGSECGHDPTPDAGGDLGCQTVSPSCSR